MKLSEQLSEISKFAKYAERLTRSKDPIDRNTGQDALEQISVVLVIGDIYKIEEFAVKLKAKRLES